MKTKIFSELYKKRKNLKNMCEIICKETFLCAE